MTPRFWWRPRPGPAAILLAPAAWLYGGSVARRMRREPEFWPPVPVICVGNFTAGGDGKTPTAIAVARIAQGLGLKPGFLTRGYGGSEPGPVLVRAGRDDPRRVGDEPLLLAEVAPTVVCGDRPKGAELLLSHRVDLIVMDDGFQNPSLGKDLTLVVADAGVGLGNGLAMPAGPLRASLRGQLALTDAIVVIGEGAAQQSLVRVAARGGKTVFRARFEPVAPEIWRGGNFTAFAGIGRPEKFFATVEQAGGTLARRRPFPDHHVYSEGDARSLLAGPAEARLVTTEKDHVRLSGGEGVLAELRSRAEVFAVRLRFDREDDIRRLIAATVEAVRLGRSRRRSGAGL